MSKKRNFANVRKTKTSIKKLNKMRKLKVNTKLVVRKVNRMDNIDKTGLTIGLLIVLPAFVAIIKDVLINGSNLI